MKLNIIAQCVILLSYRKLQNSIFFVCHSLVDSLHSLNQFRFTIIMIIGKHNYFFSIGHPVVTFGVGVKTYISYRMRLRTQKCVQKENEFYYELLKQSLPKPVHTNNTLAVMEKEKRKYLLNLS